MKNTFKRISVLMTAVLLVATTVLGLVGCQPAEIDNEKTRLVLSISELDGVFNPFYSSSGPDGQIVGMTQLAMLSSNKDGGLAYGEDEACVVLDYEQRYDAVKDQTTYYFVLKNDIRFSNGTPLTMRDVLFNIYVYLDSAYYGSATMYSTKIVGLKAYQYKLDDEFGQDNKRDEFETAAGNRLDNLEQEYLYAVEDEELTTDAAIKTYLERVVDEDADGTYKNVAKDYERCKTMLRETLQDIYTMSKGTAQDIKFVDKNGKEVSLTTNNEAFLYNVGQIVWDEDEYKFDNRLPNVLDYSEEQIITALYEAYLKGKLFDGLYEHGTYYDVWNKLVTEEREVYIEEIKKDPSYAQQEQFQRIMGINYANMEEPVIVNGTTYDVPELDKANNDCVINKDDHQVLSITIENVDPKAVWNFGFSVAPMYYYSNEEQIA
ncbi:MAG: hypothetical protein NC350_02345, partial [Corallococcus sp.]|nr:hypothetical protein [Corallococcus sp.]